MYAMDRTFLLDKSKLSDEAIDRTSLLDKPELTDGAIDHCDLSVFDCSD
jgi:hypothetical protein